MLTLSGAPSTTSHLDIYILSIFHNMGSPRDKCTLILTSSGTYIFIKHAYIFILFQKQRVITSLTYQV